MSSEKHTASELKEDYNLNIHPYYFQRNRTQQHKSVVSYHHHKSVHGRAEQTLESILGALEEHYTDENSRSLTSQLSRIADSFKLYRQNDEKPGLAPIGHKTHKKTKNSTKGGDDCECKGGCDCQCKGGDCDCECIKLYGSCECGSTIGDIIKGSGGTSEELEYKSTIRDFIIE